jgi:hypothetical protein
MHNEPTSTSGPGSAGRGRRTAAILGAALCAAAALARWWPADEGGGLGPDALAVELADQPPVREPRVLSAAATWLADDADVIGVSAGGRHRAYLVNALRPGDRHVINDTLGDVPVTVCYCERSDCPVVLTGARGAGPPEVAFGGYVGDYDLGTMLLRVGRWRHRLDDGRPWEPDGPPLPFARGAFERLTWKAWRAAHPDTDVYVGEPRRPTPGAGESPPERRESAARGHAVPAGASGLGDWADVIGVSAGGRHRAYPIRVFRRGERHVIGDDLGGVPVAVTFCPIAQCAQAFRGARGDAPPALAVVWFDGEYDWGSMVLRAGRWHYAQATGMAAEPDAPAFPYPRADCWRTTWKNWREAHPDTDLYVDGEPGVAADSAQ